MQGLESDARKELVHESSGPGSWRHRAPLGRAIGQLVKTFDIKFFLVTYLTVYSSIVPTGDPFMTSQSQT